MPATFALFEPTAEETTPAAVDRLLHPDPCRQRYRCGCGRFVATTTVKVIPHHEYGYGSEQDTRGDCSACGPDVDVTWGWQ